MPLMGSKTLQAKTAQSQERPAAGPKGAAIDPPCYGIDFVDRQVERENNTGLPDSLKAGIENLSGLAMDDVRVHYHSSKPAELQALAYTQGTDIFMGPGQERHLPHEAWHVVQQKEGRVRATMQMKEGVAVNDEEGLEREAGLMGERALRMGGRAAGRPMLSAGALGERAQVPPTVDAREPGGQRPLLSGPGGGGPMTPPMPAELAGSGPPTRGHVVPHLYRGGGPGCAGDPRGQADRTPGTVIQRVNGKRAMGGTEEGDEEMTAAAVSMDEGLRRSGRRRVPTEGVFESMIPLWFDGPNYDECLVCEEGGQHAWVFAGPRSLQEMGSDANPRLPPGIGEARNKWPHAYFKAGHLVNAEFGGAGDDSRNLTILTASANGQMNGFDNPLKNALRALHALYLAGRRAMPEMAQVRYGVKIDVKVSKEKWGEKSPASYIAKEVLCQAEVVGEEQLKLGKGLSDKDLDNKKKAVNDFVKAANNKGKIDNRWKEVEEGEMVEATEAGEAQAKKRKRKKMKL